MARRSLANRIWYESLRAVIMCALVIVYRIRYSGRKNIPPQGGVLVVSNHQSHLDPPLVGAGCPRHMNYLARGSLFRIGPFRWLIRSVGAYPIDREGIGLSGIKETLRHLKEGEMVVIFPEGTRTQDGQVGPFRPGFSALAVRTRSAILPMAMEGAFHAWPRRHKLPRPGVIHVHYGLPILPDQFGQYSEEELVREVERRVQELHAELRERPVLAAWRKQSSESWPR